MKQYKGYYIKAHKSFPRMYVVVTEGQGGKIPNVLNTMFTSEELAKFSIDQYTDYKQKLKEKSNGSKTKSESGG